MFFFLSLLCLKTFFKSFLDISKSAVNVNKIHSKVSSTFFATLTLKTRKSNFPAEVTKSIVKGIGIGFLSCIGIGIGIAKTIFQVLVLVLVLLR